MVINRPFWGTPKKPPTNALLIATNCHLRSRARCGSAVEGAAAEPGIDGISSRCIIAAAGWDELPVAMIAWRRLVDIGSHQQVAGMDR